MDKKRRNLLWVLLIPLIFIGCSTATVKDTTKIESRQEVETAVVAIKEAVTNTAVRAKYCPVCGRHYSSQLTVCPKDNTPLKEVGD